ncbi:hypothetical protein SHKM778_74240 [Streptomyces sp. KM77-8]|uniref:Uncharacterized protein n=1 Tax=Streptomyces haneummycinicus TaxID=3074435 RepID=A0AAT9HU38_9ACTN
MTPPPDGDHEDYINLVMKQVIRRSRTDMDFSGNKGLKLKSGGACPKNHAIPDGTLRRQNCGSTAAPAPGCLATVSPWWWR